MRMERVSHQFSGIKTIHKGIAQCVHGAPGARHPTCVRTSLNPAAGCHLCRDRLCGRESQLKTLAPHAPERLMHRTLCGAAMLRIAHVRNHLVTLIRYRGAAHGSENSHRLMQQHQIASAPQIAAVFERNRS
jgi:hypothetical protein